MSGWKTVGVVIEGHPILVRSGVPQAVAMQITGHRTDRMFRRYAIVDEAQKVEALNRLAQHLKTEKKKVLVFKAAK